MTNSRAFRARPCQMRSYRSRMPPALAAKSGSWGKIQLRWRQGRSASALNQRHKVAPLISATNPWVISSRRISERESRDRGKRLRQQLLDVIRKRAQLINRVRAIKVAKDPQDDKFIECADAARADYLVTGNARHFPKFWKNSKVVTSREFLALVAPRLLG